MCVLPACCHLDLDRTADLVGGGYVHLATKAEMAKIFTDGERGAEPPIGQMFGMQTIMDEQLREEWERPCHPRVARIALGTE